MFFISPLNEIKNSFLNRSCWIRDQNDDQEHERSQIMNWKRRRGNRQKSYILEIMNRWEWDERETDSQVILKRTRETRNRAILLGFLANFFFHSLPNNNHHHQMESNGYERVFSLGDKCMKSRTNESRPTFTSCLTIYSFFHEWLKRVAWLHTKRKENVSKETEEMQR